MKGIQIIFAALLLSSQLSFATGGNIMGQVVDTANNRPLSDQIVVFDCKGIERTFITNEHGFYYASNIPAGSYIIGVTNMGKTYRLNVDLEANESREINFKVSGVLEMTPVVVNGGKPEKPLIDPLNPKYGTLDHADIAKLPIADFHQIGTTLPGTVETGGEYHVHGARSEGLAYYVDGCRSLNEPNIPLCGIDLYRSYLDFIPPQYGDATGGVIVIETRNYFKENR